VIVHDIVKSSCEPDAVDIECPLPSVRESSDMADVVTDNRLDLEWKQNIERRISLYVYITVMHYIVFKISIWGTDVRGITRGLAALPSR